VSETERPQIAWKAIEPKTPVYSADGEVIGKVSQVVGDPEADVFTGLAVSPSLFGPARFVDADRVRGIWTERIELDLTAEEAQRLPEHEDAPVVRWRPDEGGFFSRLFRR
jgi:sporulation protein YlmC with PRC-barrel domain